MMDDGAMNAAALEEALGMGGMGGMGPGMDPMAPGAGECVLCGGPVDPQSGMTLAAPDAPMLPPDLGMPPGMPPMG